MTQWPAKVIEHTIMLQPGDVFGRHVNNARYFGFIAEAFLVWYEAMDLRYDPERTHGPMMAHLSYDFRLQMTFPGAVRCRLSVAAVGRSSLTHDVEIFDAAGKGELLGTGKCVHVWVDRQTGAPQPWPEDRLAKCWPQKP